MFSFAVENQLPHTDFYVFAFMCEGKLSRFFFLFTGATMQSSWNTERTMPDTLFNTCYVYEVIVLSLSI